MTIEWTLVGEFDPVSKFREDFPEKVTLSWFVEDSLLYKKHLYLFIFIPKTWKHLHIHFWFNIYNHNETFYW